MTERIGDHSKQIISPVKRNVTKESSVNNCPFRSPRDIEKYRFEIKAAVTNGPASGEAPAVGEQCQYTPVACFFIVMTTGLKKIGIAAI